MNRSEVEVIVDQVLAQILGVPATQTTSVRRDEVDTWNSLAHVDVFFSLEEDLGIQLCDDEMAFAETRDDLVDLAVANLA